MGSRPVWGGSRPGIGGPGRPVWGGSRPGWNGGRYWGRGYGYGYGGYGGYNDWWYPAAYGVGALAGAAYYDDCSYYDTGYCNYTYSNYYPAYTTYNPGYSYGYGYGYPRYVYTGRVYPRRGVYTAHVVHRGSVGYVGGVGYRGARVVYRGGGARVAYRGGGARVAYRGGGARVSMRR
jgi:hypothetical protein